ncbi:hypothetical protein [Paraglaciecola sp.]|uniref:hypothetical protein n=1 Tax=Paraglaciecola sp. TaxID=1920173 RepID=UPI003EF44BEC
MAWIKAIVFLLVIFVMWLALLVIEFASLLIAASPALTGDKDFQRFVKSVLLAEDQLVNRFLGGYWKTTISSEIGAYAIAGSETALRMEIVVNWIFYVTVKQVNHCRASIESDDLHFTPPKVRAVALVGYISSIFTLNWIFA